MSRTYGKYLNSLRFVDLEFIAELLNYNEEQATNEHARIASMTGIPRPGEVEAERETEQSYWEMANRIRNLMACDSEPRQCSDCDETMLRIEGEQARFWDEMRSHAAICA